MVKRSSFKVEKRYRVFSCVYFFLTMTHFNVYSTNIVVSKRFSQPILLTDKRVEICS